MSQTFFESLPKVQLFKRWVWDFNQASLLQGKGSLFVSHTPRGIIIEEKGQWLDLSADKAFNNTFIWQKQQKGLQLLASRPDGCKELFFFPFSLSKRVIADKPYCCGKDHYRGALKAFSNGLFFHCFVEGPKKKQLITLLYFF